MRTIYSRFYWQVGFKTHLYDLLLPQAYSDSFKRLAKSIHTDKDYVLFDAGCGSGVFLNYINLSNRSTYMGVDLLMSGVSNARTKRRFKNLLNRAYFFCLIYLNRFPCVINLWI